MEFGRKNPVIVNCKFLLSTQRLEHNTWIEAILVILTELHDIKYTFCLQYLGFTTQSNASLIELICIMTTLVAYDQMLSYRGDLLVH